MADVEDQLGPAKAILLTLAPIAEDYKDKDTAHFFAKELDSQIRKYFSFLLNQSNLSTGLVHTSLLSIHNVFLSPC